MTAKTKDFKRARNRSYILIGNICWSPIDCQPATNWFPRGRVTASIAYLQASSCKSILATWICHTARPVMLRHVGMNLLTGRPTVIINCTTSCFKEGINLRQSTINSGRDRTIRPTWRQSIEIWTTTWTILPITSDFSIRLKPNWNYP